MVMADSFNFELVSPERLLLSGSVEAVVLPATEGEMTVMGNHAPTMTTVQPGVVTVKFADGKTDRYVVFGGFADILPSGCTLLAESAVHVDEISRDDIIKRVEVARAELDAALNDEHRASIERYIAQLGTVQGTILPA